MFVIQTEIARPVRDVFSRLTRVEDAPLWYSAVEEVIRLDDGPLRVGARYQFTRQFVGRPALTRWR